MGWTFSTALMKHSGPPGEAKKALLRGLKKAFGYVPAKEGEEPEARLTLYSAKSSGWLSMVSEELFTPDALDDGKDTLQMLAKAMKAPILFFTNFDSDLLGVGLTDGVKLQTAWAGYTEMLEEYGLPAEPDDLSLFDATLPDAARSRLREILKSEQTFSEDIAAEIAQLIGIPEDLVLIGPEEAPYAELELVKERKAERMPFLMPADAPPALRWKSSSSAYFVNLDIVSKGGESRGIGFLIEAVDYDPTGWDIPVVTLLPPSDNIDARRANAVYIVPERTSTGWRGIVPDMPILRGVTPDAEKKHPGKAFNYNMASGITLFAAFVPREGTEPCPYHYESACQKGGMSRFTVVPLGNPEGGFAKVVDLYSWSPTDEYDRSIDWWMGPYKPEL